MSTLIELLSDLRSRGVVLSVEAGRLQCNAPKGVITPEIRQALATQKQEIIKLLSEPVAIKNRPLETDASELPLSSSQRRLWFVQRMDPKNPVYHMAVAIDMTGELQRGILDDTLRALVSRHESLRTSFHEKNGQPLAQIIDAENWSPIFVDLTHLSHEDAREEAERSAIEKARQPFALDLAPLIRAVLYRLAHDRHLLVLIMHHIVSDGWSLGILAREIGSIYSDLSAGKRPSLSPLTARYQDFVLWENEIGQRGQDLHLPYWMEQLKGAQTQLDLSGRRRSAVPSFAGRRTSIPIDASLRDAVEKRSREFDVTPFMFLLAAFKVLLYRYTGQSDLLIGTGNSNRAREEFTSVVGFFVDNLVLRSDLSGNPPFRDFLRQIRQTTHEAYAHQELPFSVLMGKLQPERELSRNPLFQVAFVMQNVPLDPIHLPGLSIDAKPLDIRISPMDLSVGVWPEGDTYRVDFEFSTDLFDEGFIFSLQSHYLNLLRQIIDDPGQRIENIPFVTAEERRQLLVEWNDTVLPYPSFPIHSVFEQCVRTRGEATALKFGAGKLTYAELNLSADSIAKWLAGCDLPAHSFVAVCAPGTALGIAAFLGVLKAGHAYFPISVSDPPERLKGMFKDAGATVLLTTAAFRGRLELLGIPSIALLEDISAQPRNDFNGPSIVADDPACLMFTSGSTGKPKGVVIPHRSIVRLVRGANYVRYSSEEVLLQASALTFDASTPEIWGALLNGAELVLIDSEQPDPEKICRAIRDHQVTTVMFTTALFHHLVADRLDSITTLRQIMVGGDILSPSHVARLLHAAPNTHLINAYGPTENGTMSTTYLIMPESLDGNSIPIGRPISNSRVFLLDANRQPVPAGAIGEMYVAGDGLALGYLNAPDQTAQAFVTLNFDEVSNVRAYRTGDLARYRPNGDLEFLGRTDKQVKLRGYRIELGEVEQALLSIEGIRAAVVSMRTRADSEQKLVAYVVLDSGVVPDPRDLQLRLRRILQRPQIPAAFLFITEIPQTQNGKIDYDKLAALPLESLPARAEVRSPANAAEDVLLGAFSDLLHAEGLTVEDDFFSAGGHSLLAMQLLSRIATSFAVTLSVADIFQNPTVELLAARIESLGGGARAQSLAETKDADRSSDKREHALSRAQRRLWFLDQMDPGNPVYNIAIALHMDGPLNRSAFEEALLMMVIRHESLRTRFLQRDGFPYALVEDVRKFDVDFVDLSSRSREGQEEALRELISVKSQLPYALDQGPLFHISLYRRSDREHVVLMAMHHIISDGWSIGLLAQELGRTYEARVKRLPSPLKPLPLQFRDFVQWEAEQEKQSSGEDLAYWRRKLSGELPQLQLPTDYARPPVQTFRGNRIIADLDADLHAKLQELARKYNATFYMVLVAAFSVMLRQYTRQEDILIGTPTAGRTKSSFESLIGLFVNNLVLRVDLASNPSFAELLRRVRGVALEAFEHQSTPFDQLVEILQPERSLDRSPIFQVLFTLQNTAMPSMRFDELVMKPLDFEGYRARYDLAVDVYPHEDHFRCNFEFNTEIFEEATIQQMLSHYMRILKTVCGSADQPISRISLLDDSERRQLIDDWNRTAAPAPAYETVTSWFRSQAGSTPHATAVEMGDQTLTFQELDAESDKLAVDLRSRGIGRGAVVGIYMNRSPKLVIGLLGILKASAAYLPLDPALPGQRIDFMLSDAQVPIILTERELSATLPPTSAALLLIEDIGKTAASHVPDEVHSSDLAYLIYTSGSTGNPKGTEIQHAALINLLGSMLKEPGLTANDTLVAVTTISFDIAGLEIFGPLVCGAKLILASREQTIDPELLADLLDFSHATVMQATPSTWRMLVESGWTGRPAMRMWCGGEALSPDLADNLIARGGELWNLYGPTETTIWSAAHRVRSGESPILIGRPIANTQMYVLGEDLEPVPIGVAGELYIGGDGVARGYLNRPDLTASRFLPDHFDVAGKRRIYRTGDLARYRRDGQIQLLGRTDHQIKLRGHRIELGEIEVAIERHPAVRQAVVVLRGEGTAKQLVGYIRFVEDLVDVDQLRAWLHETLPDYMVPGSLVTVDDLPMTPNGKVDRKRLPSPQALPRESKNNSIAARNSTEQRLSELWATLLHIEQPGVRENFFDLGGHSLLLVQLHSQLKREFNSSIAVVDLFRYPTIEALASFLDRKRSESSTLVGADVS